MRNEPADITSAPVDLGPCSTVRVDIPTPLAELFQILQDDLTKAGLACAHPQDDGLGGGVVALRAVVHFINSINDWQERGLAQPLANVLEALYDVGRGSRHPMLRVRAPKGQPVSHDQQVIRRYAAAGTETLRRKGHKLEEAAKIVAREINRHGIPVKGKQGDYLWKTVLSWRENLEGYAGSDELHRQQCELYRDRVEYFVAHPEDDVKAAIARLASR